MWNKVLNIFKPTNSNKTNANRKEEFDKVYFDRAKKSFIEVRLNKDLTCQDIHSIYHNEILGELMKNNRDNYGSSSMKTLNANEFSFMIIDDENVFTEIKMKMKDCPWKFIKKKSINLYYLNMSANNRKEETTPQASMSENYSSYSNKAMETEASLSCQTMPMSAGNDEGIREGQLMKYSKKYKKFDKRTVVLDKEKLIITKPKNKGKIIK
jgi:hypothetical protein